MFDFTSIPELTLSVGSHKTPEEGLCFSEAIAFFAGEPHSDWPEEMQRCLEAYDDRARTTLAAGDEG